MSADLERRSQFDVHAGHQVVLGQQQQRLAVDLLQAERLGHVAAAWKVRAKQIRQHTPLNTAINGREQRRRWDYSYWNFAFFVKCSRVLKQLELDSNLLVFQSHDHQAGSRESTLTFKSTLNLLLFAGLIPFPSKA